MRVVFAGTPEFAVPALRALVAAGHGVPLVVSQPDRPKGRGQILEPTPVHAAATELGLNVVQPEKLKEAESAIRDARPDVIVTAAYGQKVSSRILALAPHGGLNVHASILPRHRGASPVSAAILAGDAETGITIFRMVKDMDAGPVLVTATIPVPAGATTGTLEPALAALAPGTLLEALRRLDSGTAVFAEQDHAGATLAPKLAKGDGRLDWTRPAAELDRRLRAMTPWPGGACIAVRPDGTRFRLAVLAASPVAETRGAPGELIEVRKGALRVRCGDGALDLLRVQPESRKPQTADEFANGFRLKDPAGWRFEAPPPDAPR